LQAAAVTNNNNNNNNNNNDDDHLKKHSPLPKQKQKQKIKKKMNFNKLARSLYGSLKAQAIDTSSVDHYFRPKSNKLLRNIDDVIAHERGGLMSRPGAEEVCKLLQALDAEDTDSETESEYEIDDNDDDDMGDGLDSGSSTTDVSLCLSSEDLFSRNAQIDILTFMYQATPGDVAVVRETYKDIAYGVKMPYMRPADGPSCAKFAMRKMNFLEQEPGEPTVENVLYMDTQSSKSSETAWAAWCSFFVCGCVPIILVRNSGGRVQGVKEMTNAINDINARVDKSLKTNFPDMTETERKRFQLDVRVKVEDVRIERARMKNSENAKITMRPQVLICLNNVTQLRKLGKEVKVRKQKYRCVIKNIQKSRSGLKKFLVEIHEAPFHGKTLWVETGRVEPRGHRRSRAKPTGKRKDRLRKHAPCTVKLTPEQRTDKSLLEHLRGCGMKKGDKYRATLLIDEADLTVGDVHRTGNKGTRMLYDDERPNLAAGRAASEESENRTTEDDEDSEDEDEVDDLVTKNARKALRAFIERRKGLQDWVFATMSITATPVALFMNSFAGAEGQICWCCGLPVDVKTPHYICERHGTRTNRRGCERVFHLDCIANMAENVVPGLRHAMLQVPGLTPEKRIYWERVRDEWNPWANESGFVLNPGHNVCGFCPHCVNQSARVPDDDVQHQAIVRAGAIFDTLPSENSDGSSSEVSRLDQHAVQLLDEHNPDLVRQILLETDPETRLVKQTSDADARKIKPHLVIGDKPQNYMRYAEQEHSADQALSRANINYIVRREVDERINTKPVALTSFYEEMLKQDFLLARYKPDVSAYLRDVRAASEAQKGKRHYIDHSGGWYFLTPKNARVAQIKTPTKKHCSDRTKFLIGQARANREIVNQLNREHRGARADGPNIKVMVDDMLTTPNPQGYRHGLVITSSTRRIAQMNGIRDFLITEYADHNLVAASFNGKGISIRLTEALKSRACPALNVVGSNAFSDSSGDESDGTLTGEADISYQSVVLLKIREVARDMFKQNMSADAAAVKADLCVSMNESGEGLRMEKIPINVLYSALKLCPGCNTVVIVTGELGGRGTSYHDIEHTRLLTDMFMAVDVSDSTQITMHGEMLVQNLGRLNTIFTERAMHAPGKIPILSLWASASVHHLHAHHLRQIWDDVLRVREKGSYELACKSQPRYTTGIRRNGSDLYSRKTRGKIETGMPRVHAKIKASLPEKRVTTINIADVVSQNFSPVPGQEVICIKDMMDADLMRAGPDIISCFYGKNEKEVRYIQGNNGRVRIPIRLFKNIELFEQYCAHVQIPFYNASFKKVLRKYKQRLEAHRAEYGAAAVMEEDTRNPLRATWVGGNYFPSTPNLDTRSPGGKVFADQTKFLNDLVQHNIIEGEIQGEYNANAAHGRKVVTATLRTDGKLFFSGMVYEDPFPLYRDMMQSVDETPKPDPWSHLVYDGKSLHDLKGEYRALQSSDAGASSSSASNGPAHPSSRAMSFMPSNQ
jgi:hypothetical protein